MAAMPMVLATSKGGADGRATGRERAKRSAPSGPHVCMCALPEPPMIAILRVADARYTMTHTGLAGAFLLASCPWP